MISGPIRGEEFQSQNPQNPAKGGIYISRDHILEMMDRCDSSFETDCPDDEKAAFGYFKESKSMQIIGGQIGSVLTVRDRERHGIECRVLLMNIDLYFRGTLDVMYLVAMLNDEEWRDKMKWKIQCFLTAQQILSRFGIEGDRLPLSSRAPLKKQLDFPPTPRNLPYRDAMDMIRRTRFHSLCGKNSKRRKCTLCADGGGRKCTLFVLDDRKNMRHRRMCRSCGHSAADQGIQSTEQLHSTLRIHPRDLKRIVHRHWSDDTASFVPVVVNKPKVTN